MTDMLKSMEGCVACDWVGIPAAEQVPALEMSQVRGSDLKEMVKR